MTTSDSIPQIVCGTCKRLFPATAEFFYRKSDSKNGLSSRCKICAREYDMRYRLMNIENRREYDKQWRINNLERAKRNQASWRGRNRERNAKRHADWQRANATRVNEKNRRWRAANKDKQDAAIKRWRLLNPDRNNAMQQRHRAAKRALPSTFTIEQWQECLEWWNNTCAYCGAQQSFWFVLEQEHVIPVSGGGGYTADNIVPACKSCNASKNNTPAIEWLIHSYGKRKAKTIINRINEYFEWLKEQK